MRRLAVIALVGCGSTPPPPVISSRHAGDRPTTVSIVYDFSSFQNAHREYTLVLDNGAYTANGRSIDPRIVDALADAQTQLRPADGIYECTSHTDDYRTYRIVAAGPSPYELRAQSNCTHEIPWHVIRDRTLYVQFTGDLGIAVERLLAAVDPDFFSAPDPELFRTPRGAVLMGNYYNFNNDPYASTSEPIAGVTQAPSVAAACAKSIETSPELRDVVGEAIHVSMMSLVCDLETEPDCHRVEAEATFDWMVATIRYPLPCVDGALQLARQDREMFDGLRAFFTSRPVRVALGKRTSKPEVVPGGTGNFKLWADDTDHLSLEVTLPKREIEVFSYVGPASTKFWTDLGIDMKRVTRKDPYRDQATGRLDFDGHLLP